MIIYLRLLWGHLRWWNSLWLRLWYSCCGWVLYKKITLRFEWIGNHLGTSLLSIIRSLLAAYQRLSTTYAGTSARDDRFCCGVLAARQELATLITRGSRKAKVLIVGYAGTRFRCKIVWFFQRDCDPCVSTVQKRTLWFERVRFQRLPTNQDSSVLGIIPITKRVPRYQMILSNNSKDSLSLFSYRRTKLRWLDSKKVRCWSRWCSSRTRSCRRSTFPSMRISTAWSIRLRTAAAIPSKYRPKNRCLRNRKMGSVIVIVVVVQALLDLRLSYCPIQGCCCCCSRRI